MTSWILTPRQREVLQLRADGYSHEETAHKLRINRTTVTDNIQRAKKKLGARTTHHAIALAIRSGYIR